MRTNIVLDDALVREAMRYSRHKTKAGLVEEALRTYVEIKSAERRVERYEERINRLRGQLDNLRLRDEPHVLLRDDRDRR